MDSNYITFNNYSFSIGEVLDVCDRLRNWYLATVIVVCEHKIKIHYNQWSSQYDEWITDNHYYQRLAAANTYSIAYTELSTRQYFSKNLSPMYYISNVDNKEYIVWIEYESASHFKITLQDIKTNQFRCILTHYIKYTDQRACAAFMNVNCNKLYIQSTNYFIVIDLDTKHINPKVPFHNRKSGICEPKICNVNHQMHCIYPSYRTNLYTVMQMNNSLNQFITIISNNIVTDNLKVLVSTVGRYEMKAKINLLYDKVHNRILFITKFDIYFLDRNTGKNIWRHLLTLTPIIFSKRHAILAFDSVVFLFYETEIHCIDLIKQKEYISKKKIPIKFDDVVKTRDNYIHFINQQHKHIRIRLSDFIPKEITDEYVDNCVLKSQHFPHLKQLLFGYMKEQEKKLNVQITIDVQQIIWMFFPVFC
eukprot:267217_1